MQICYLEAIGCNSQRLCDPVELSESVQSAKKKKKKLKNSPKNKRKKEVSLMIYRKMGIYRMKTRRQRNLGGEYSNGVLGTKGYQITSSP